MERRRYADRSGGKVPCRRRAIIKYTRRNGCTGTRIIIVIIYVYTHIRVWYGRRVYSKKPKLRSSGGGVSPINSARRSLSLRRRISVFSECLRAREFMDRNYERTSRFGHAVRALVVGFTANTVQQVLYKSDIRRGGADKVNR